MAKKDFLSMIDNSIEQKREVNLKLENQNLKDKIKDLQNQLNSTSNDIYVFKISELNLRSNIRDNYEFEEIEELAEDISKNGQLQPVVITKDNYLIAGYRRYHALKYLNQNAEVLVNQLNKNNDEIDETELKEIQFAENNQRRNIDNFQLCSLLNWYIEKGYSQKDLAEKFKKSKGVISVILGIKNLDEHLVKYFKEFQLYGVSYKKFVGTNSEEQQSFLDKKELIGYRPLYSIAKLDIEEQKKAFLKIYGNRLSEEEINSEYFGYNSESLEKKKKNDTYQVALKNINNLNSLINKLKSDFSEDELKDIQKAMNHLKKIENILGKKI